MKTFKRILTLTLVLVLLFSVAACSEKEDETTDSSGQISTVNPDETSASEPVIASPIYMVEIKSELVENENVKANLLYPKLSGYNNSETEEKVNAIIRSYVEGKMNELANSVKALSSLAFDIPSYEIKSFEVTCKNDDLFSALCRGSITYSNNTNTMDFSYGINVDLKNSKLMGLDFVVDYDGFEKSFINGDFKQTGGYQNLLKETNHADLISRYDPLYRLYPEYYIRSTDNGYALGIITETVPLLGYVAEFEGELNDAKFVKEDFKAYIN